MIVFYLPLTYISPARGEKIIMALISRCKIPLNLPRIKYGASSLRKGEEKSKWFLSTIGNSTLKIYEYKAEEKAHSSRSVATLISLVAVVAPL